MKPLDYIQKKLQECPPQRAEICGCIGPQNGEPVCPCAMKNVRVEGGRFIQRIDLGPASLAAQVNASKLLGGKR